VFTAGPFLFPQSIQAIEVNCSNSGTINVEEYVAPRCGGGDCPVVGASSIGEGFAYIGNVTNYVEWVSDSKFKQHSNDVHFLYTVEGNVIKFLRDTIWGGGPANGFFACDGTSQEAFYQVYDANNNWGRGILATSMSCGQIYESSGHIESYAKDPSMETNMNEGPFNSCNVQGQTGIVTPGAQQLIFEGPAICNSLNPIDVIITTNLGGAGAGEVYVYCKGYGLCAWYQSIDFDVDSPADWDETTDVCALDASSSIDRDPYFVEPINGMYDFELNNYKDPGNLIFDKVYEDLVAQGYQAYCSIPDLKYIASSNTNEIMLEDIIGIAPNDVGGPAESKPGNRVTVSIEDYKQFFSYIDSQTPLWRKDGIFVLKDKDSLENFWSNKNTTPREGLRNAEFSPAFSLLTPKEQCVEKKKILKAVDKKCRTLENSETCALNISYSPGSQAYWDLHRSIEQNGFECDLMNQPDENLSPSQVSIKHNLLDMPFVLPTSYRYAFVVYSAELREPRIVDSQSAIWSETTRKPGFDFLRYTDKEGKTLTEPNAKPRNEVRILAFLVPDFTTNQDDFEFTYTPPPEIKYPTLSSTGGTPRLHQPTYAKPDLNFKDSVKIARNAIQKLEVQDAYLAKWRAIKEGNPILDPFKNDGVTWFTPFEGEPDPDSEEDKLIECLYWHGQPTIGAYSCVAPMEKALTTFVNRRIENPADCNEEIIKWEENRTIYSDAGITRADAGLFHLYNGSAGDFLSGNVHIPEGDTSVHMLDNGLYPNDVANIIDNTDDDSAEPITDLKKKVFSFRFLSHYSFSSFYDGNDPLYGGEEHQKSQDTQAVIHGYLVYPVGYELKGAEETFLREFLTTEQIKQFEDEWDSDIAGDDVRDPWFKMENVDIELSANTATHPEKFLYKTDSDCRSSYNSYVASDPDPLQSYDDFKLSSCRKSPEASIKIFSKKDLEPRILGAKFGLVTIKFQQALREIGSPTWDYITSCLESDTPTEDFLTGRCSGVVERDGMQDNEEDPDTDYMNTELIVDVTTDCSGVRRFDGSVGAYELQLSEFSCTIDDSITGSSDNAVEYIDDIHGIDEWTNGSDRITCGKDLYEMVGCTFQSGGRPTLISHEVDSSGKFEEGTGTTACEYVQDRAAEQNVSPRLALSIWIEETGASAYTSESGGPDFGVLSQKTSRQSGTIEDQLRLFLGTINSNRNIAYPRFLLQYSGELLYASDDPDQNWRDWQVGDPVLFCRNRAFAGRLKHTYEQLGRF